MIFEILTFVVIFLITYSFGDLSNEAIDIKFMFISNIKRSIKYKGFLETTQKIKLFTKNYLKSICFVLTIILIINYLINILSNFRLALIIVFLFLIYFNIINFLDKNLKKKIIEIKFQNDKIFVDLISLFDDKFRKTMIEYIKNNLNKELEDSITIFNKNKIITETFQNKINYFKSFNQKFEENFENHSRFTLCKYCNLNKQFIKKDNQILRETSIIIKRRKSFSLESLKENFKKKINKKKKKTYFFEKCEKNCGSKLKTQFQNFEKLKHFLN